VRRLVEAELLLELLDERRIEPLRTAILGGRLATTLAARLGGRRGGVPEICAITRSTGPPGANCTMAKLINMIPNRVGTMSKTRFKR